jgi:hypothetical protein
VRWTFPGILLSLRASRFKKRRPDQLASHPAAFACFTSLVKPEGSLVCTSATGLSVVDR